MNKHSALLVGLIGAGLLFGCGDDDVKKTENNTTNNASNGSSDSSTNSAAAGGLSNYLILIGDVTTGDLCNVPDPGSDIIFVAVENSQGRRLAYGSLAYDGTVGEYNEYNIGWNLDGSPPWTIGCPEFSEESVTALGCGGAIGLVFPGLPRLTTEMQIRVSEFGSQCTGGPSNDSFEVFLCTDKDEVLNDHRFASCTIALGKGSGEVLVQVVID